MTEPEAVAQAVAAIEAAADKPVFACFMGGTQVAVARARLIEREVACFEAPEAAVEAFATLAAYARNQAQLLQLPGPVPALQPIDVDSARRVIASALAAGRTTLAQHESFAVLAAFGIAHVPSARAATLEQALDAARRIGFPVVLKIDSPDITHKRDVGGVRLGIDELALRSAHAELMASAGRHAPNARIDGVVVQAMLAIEHGRELLVGVSRDGALGPAIACGAGGTLVELIGGVAVELPPLDSALARSLWQRSRIAPWLAAYRGMPPADVAALERVLSAVSDLACELDAIEELDINPLVVGPSGAVALDARVVVRARPPAARYAHLAIAPPPRELIQAVVLDDAQRVALRALRPEDGELGSASCAACRFARSTCASCTAWATLRSACSWSSRSSTTIESSRWSRRSSRTGVRPRWASLATCATWTARAAILRWSWPMPFRDAASASAS
jgi:acetyltransferase